MAAAVMQPLQGLSLDGGIMPPSPVNANTSRHGRSKHGGSVAKKGRGRGYSTVDDREALISKALIWVLKRTVKEDEEEEDEQQLVADEEGWVDCEDAVSYSWMSRISDHPTNTPLAQNAHPRVPLCYFLRTPIFYRLPRLQIPFRP